MTLGADIKTEMLAGATGAVDNAALTAFCNAIGVPVAAAIAAVGGGSSNTIRNGAGAPGAGVGNNGDFYIDTTAKAIYGPKTAGAWGSGTSLVGPAGANGTNGTNGTNGAAEQGAYLSALGVAVSSASAAGSFTPGTSFLLSRAMTCTGVRFYWPSGTGTKTVKVSIWNVAGTRLANGSASVSTNGIITISFSAPVSLNAGELYTIGYWETGGSIYIKATLSTVNTWAPARPFYAGMGVFVEQITLFGTGDAKPTSTAASEGYLCDPVLA